MNNNSELHEQVSWSLSHGGKFYQELLQHLVRLPVDVKTFITHDDYLGIKTAYPGIVEALEEIYHPSVEGLCKPLRIGTEYKEVLLTGSLGCGKSYCSVLGILYGVYLLSCLRNPHALFDLDPSSEIVFLFQSIRLQTGGVCYKLARELVSGSKYFTKYFKRDANVKNELLFPNNIVLRPVSGDVTAAIGMNIVSGIWDEMSFMKHHAKSVYGEDGGEFDQANALYNSAKSRIESRFSKFGRHLIPMFLAGSARHENDFIQAKKRLAESSQDKHVYIYNKTVWEVKPFAFSGDKFRVFVGDKNNPPQIIAPDNSLFGSSNTIDVPLELKASFQGLPIKQALRDVCGIPSQEIGNFIVEPERALEAFNIDNMFAIDSTDFVSQEGPVTKTFYQKPKTDRVWIAHLDLSRTNDSTGIALGYVDRWDKGLPYFTVAGLLEVQPLPGSVIPWEPIMEYLKRLSKVIPLYGVTADQVGAHYIWEHLVPHGFKVAKVSDTPDSRMFHQFHNLLLEGRVSIANHPKTKEELLALNVDEKTGKVMKPAGGSKDCVDALVSLVSVLSKVKEYKIYPENWSVPSNGVGNTKSSQITLV